MPKNLTQKKNKIDIENEISRCVNQLLLKEPFFSHILSGTVRTISLSVPTAAVGVKDGTIVLFINENFFLNHLKTSSQRIAVLKHETLHLVFKHLFRELFIKDQELMNLAADIVVNQYIGEWDLPESAITLNAFSDLNLEAGQTMEYYYNRLRTLQEENLSPKNGKNIKFPISQKALERLYGSERHSDHSIWVDKKDSVVQSGLQESLENQLMNAAARCSAKSIGNLPADITRIIDVLIKGRQPKIDWKRQLRLFASSHGKTYVHHTMKRVSKRYGTRPGIRIRRRNRLVVVIDTSGSITDESLQIFMCEIEGIRRGGAEVVIIEADCKVQQVSTYRRGLKISVRGGGGTNYDPSFEYINTGKSGSFDACIYFTDGYASEPKVKPRTPLLWVLTADGDDSGLLKWGRRVIMTYNDEILYQYSIINRVR